MEAELQSVRDTLGAANLSEGVRQSVSWCLSQLPRLYGEFLQNYDVRYRDEIRRLLQGVLQALAKESGAAGLVETLINQLRAMHEQLGIPGIDLKPPARSRKAA